MFRTGGTRQAYGRIDKAPSASSIAATGARPARSAAPATRAAIARHPTRRHEQNGCRDDDERDLNALSADRRAAASRPTTVIAHTGTPVRSGAKGAATRASRATPQPSPTRNGHAVTSRPPRTASSWLARPMAAKTRHEQAEDPLRGRRAVAARPASGQRGASTVYRRGLGAIRAAQRNRPRRSAGVSPAGTDSSGRGRFTLDAWQRNPRRAGTTTAPANSAGGTVRAGRSTTSTSMTGSSSCTPAAPRERAGTTGWYDDGRGASAGGTDRRWTDAATFSGEEQSLAGIVVDGRWIHFGAWSQPVAGTIATHASGAELLKRGRLSRPAVARTLYGPSGSHHAAPAATHGRRQGELHPRGGRRPGLAGHGRRRAGCRGAPGS